MLKKAMFGVERWATDDDKIKKVDGDFEKVHDKKGIEAAINRLTEWDKKREREKERGVGHVIYIKCRRII